MSSGLHLGARSFDGSTLNRFRVTGVYYPSPRIGLPAAPITNRGIPMTPRSFAPARMLTGMMLVAFVVMAATSAFAQPPRMSAEDRTKRLTEQLTLNEDQAKKVLAIYKHSEEDMRKIFESAGDDRDAMRETMRAHREKVNKEIEALLTADQKTKFEEIRKQGPPQRGGGDRRPPEQH